MKVREIARRRRAVRRKPIHRVSARMYARHYSRHLKPGTVIETCGCDVARVVQIDADNDDCYYESLTQPGVFGSCSIVHCGPLPLRPAAVARRLEIFTQSGRNGLMSRYWREDCRMSEEQVASMLRQYNYDVES